MNKRTRIVESNDSIDKGLGWLPKNYVNKAIEKLAEQHQGECPYSRQYIVMVKAGSRRNDEILDVLVALAEANKKEKYKVRDRIQKLLT